MDDYGIRVFYKTKAGEQFEDYDSVYEEDYGFDGDNFIVNGDAVYHKLDVINIHTYERLDEKIGGIYIRVFDDESALRYKADKLVTLKVKIDDR